MTEPGGPACTIREIRPSEFEALGDLTVRAYADLLSPSDEDYLDELRDVAARAAAVPVIVAVDDDGRVLGGVAYVPGPGTPLSEGERDGEAGFRMLAVDPAAAGRGVGRALAEACIARARAEGRTGMTLYTLPTMVVAHRLYESLGFRRDPERDWEYLPGEWIWSYTTRFRRIVTGVGSGVVEPRPAATVVLLRPGEAGLEALLTHRPVTMAFAGGAHVFPGGRVDPADADPRLAARSVVSGTDAAVALGGDLPPTAALAAYMAAIRESFEEAGILLADTAASAARIGEARSALLRGDATLPGIAEDLDLRLRTDLLVPLSRWVTPIPSPRRFDTRFFAATLPEGTEPTFEGDEVAAHEWLRPSDALAAMADGRLVLWLPTSTTLQQLEFVTSLDEIRERLAPGTLGSIEVDEVADDVTRIVMPAGGGVAGQPVCAYLVGRRRCVLVDPGDPTGPALDRAIALAAERGSRIDAIALTHADPDHAAGAQAVAERLGIPVMAGPGAGRSLPYEVRQLADLQPLTETDVPFQAIWTPGPRPDHLAFIVGDGSAVVSGDLDGVRGARAIVGSVDPAALAASRARLDELAPAAPRLPGHPSV